MANRVAQLEQQAEERERQAEERLRQAERELEDLRSQMMKQMRGEAK